MNLSKQSKDLILFFTKNKHLNYVQQTNKTKILLSELYKEILEAHSFINKRNIYNYTIKKIQSATQIVKPQNFNSNSFPEIVRNHIDENMTTEICYTFSLYERNVKVYFIIENDSTEINIKLYNKYIQHIIHF